MWQAEWEQCGKNSYRTSDHKGRMWSLWLLSAKEGHFPPGWRLMRKGTRSTKAVAAEDRTLKFVHESAEMIIRENT